jgi:2-dehydro-3-deoxyphosphogluconate aldolase / (4S)-4-hydroxy-2-oxoglutarate aldolase
VVQTQERLQHDFRALLARERVLPVVVIDDPDQARPLADALRAGGLGCIEVTLRTPAALEAIRRIRAMGQLKVGAGTVLDAEQVRAARDAGAEFIVAPGLDLDVVDTARSLHLPVLPGIATATELMAARRLGLDLLKFFPAEALGGAATLRAFASLVPGVGFVPTGGVSERNCAGYLDVPAVVACGGTWLAPRELLAAADDAAIAGRAAAASALAVAAGGR